ncbi:hypothetical protein HPB47_011932 [Ixodes persulcatus]|uniref:Uncharacterized protein n=1 Tax=Ixodes persulcatus TaxID=34615 RepID=A0AC60NV51_IXOPE|nr:hypothetical protein HPB47_011932 [Ixodes persulcatus]
MVGRLLLCDAAKKPPAFSILDLSSFRRHNPTEALVSTPSVTAQFKGNGRHPSIHPEASCMMRPGYARPRLFAFGCGVGVEADQWAGNVAPAAGSPADGRRTSRSSAQCLFACFGVPVFARAGACGTHPVNVTAAPTCEPRIAWAAATQLARERRVAARKRSSPAAATDDAVTGLKSSAISRRQCSPSLRVSAFFPKDIWPDRPKAMKIRETQI